MPELPEVETIRREVLPYVRGKTIAGAELIDKRSVKGIAPAKFKQEITGKKILDLERRAKYLLFKLASGKYLVIHLGMTGRLLFSADKYVKVIFNLSGGKKLFFSDARLFGKIRLFDHYPLLKLGPEPLTKDFTEERFKTLLQKRKTSVKTALMDQNFIAGVGNIYAAEALFAARINPQRKTSSLSDAEIKKLYEAINAVLREAIKYRGTSSDWYLDARGKEGSFQNRLKAYGRANKPCPRCGTPIKRIAMGNRGTFFCPKCQK